jgi:flagellar biosynthetic protein FliR
MAEVEIFKLFLLVMARVSGLIVIAPVLGSANFPVIAKVGLTGFTAMLLTPTLPALADPLPDPDIAFSMLAAGEFLVGLLIGFLLTLLFSAIQVAGQIMDLQTGFGFMNVFNPAFETQFPVFGFVLFLLAVLYLIVIDGHLMMIRALVSTYEHVPVGGFVARPELLLEVSRMGRYMFLDGVIIAAPITTAMLLAYITMGLLGRVVPQIHLFVVGFPITIATGLFLLAFSIGFYVYMLDGMFFRMFKHVEDVIPGLG